MGKTAVFCISVLNRLQKDPNPISALVLCHTRELAHQISKEFERLGKYRHDVRAETLYGGVPMETHKELLKKNPPHIIVGTPGRVLDLANRGFLKFNNLKFFIMDECDKMLL